MHLLRISFFILLTSVIGFAEEGPGWVESERPSPEQGLAWAAPARGGSAHPGGERWDESTEATPLEEAMSLGEASSAESPAGQPMALTAGGNEADEVTPAIAELARGLRYDPLKIFQYVYNYIEYEPYFGSKKGAHLTLLEGSGNEFDQCALLVALLRAADLNPSYKYGPCSFTYNELVSWMGLSATPYDHWTNTEFAAYYGITDTSSGNIAKLRQWLGVYEFLTPRGYFYVDSFQSGGTNFFSLPHYELVRQSNGTYTVTKQGKTNQK